MRRTVRQLCKRPPTGCLRSWLSVVAGQGIVDIEVELEHIPKPDDEGREIARGGSLKVPEGGELGYLERFPVWLNRGFPGEAE
jgi:hypothetical protein